MEVDGLVARLPLGRPGRRLLGGSHRTAGHQDRGDALQLCVGGSRRFGESVPNVLLKPQGGEVLSCAGVLGIIVGA